MAVWVILIAYYTISPQSLNVAFLLLFHLIHNKSTEPSFWRFQLALPKE